MRKRGNLPPMCCNKWGVDVLSLPTSDRTPFTVFMATLYSQVRYLAFIRMAPSRISAKVGIRRGLHRDSATYRTSTINVTSHFGLGSAFRALRMSPAVRKMCRKLFNAVNPNTSFSSRYLTLALSCHHQRERRNFSNLSTTSSMLGRFEGSSCAISSARGLKNSTPRVS